MHIYDSEVYELDSGEFIAVIFKVSHDKTDSDPIMERILSSKQDAVIWADDEICRLVTGKGVWA